VFLTDFLRQHDCAAIVDEKDTIAIENAIQNMIQTPEYVAKITQNALNTAQIFGLDRVVADLRNHIQQNL
jgi:polyhydroxyalkanoate synthesis regulator phasin